MDYLCRVCGEYGLLAYTAYSADKPLACRHEKSVSVGPVGTYPAELWTCEEHFQGHQCRQSRYLEPGCEPPKCDRMNHGLMKSAGMYVLPVEVV